MGRCSLGMRMRKDGVGKKNGLVHQEEIYITKETKLRRMNVVGENWTKVRMKDKQKQYQTETAKCLSGLRA